MPPDLLVLGNLIVDDVVLPDGTTRMGQPGGAVIGPNSAESLGDLLVLERHGIQSAAARRVKRTTDIAISLVLLATAPLSVWFVENGTGMLRNALVLLHRYIE